jgi:hypothetical protein
MYGLLAEFASEAELIEAVRKLHKRGFRYLDAYAPYPLPALAEILGIRSGLLERLIVTVTVLAAGGLFYLLEYVTAVWVYPHNVSGKPYGAWPALLPSAAVIALLAGGIAALLAMLFRARLPHPYHPVSATADFTLSAKHRFYLVIEARDPLFDGQTVRTILTEGGTAAVSEIAP